MLGGQNIGPKGAQALGEALRKNTTLKELHLHNNDLGYEVRKNDSLKELPMHDSDHGTLNCHCSHLNFPLYQCRLGNRDGEKYQL